MNIMKRIISTLIVISFFLNSIDCFGQKYVDTNCLSPVSSLQGSEEKGFAATVQNGMDLLGKHRSFHAFIKKDVPGYSKDNPGQNVPDEAVLYKTSFGIDLHEENIVIPEDFYRIIESEFPAIDISKFKDYIRKIFQYRITHFPENINSIKSLEKNLGEKGKADISVMFINNSNTLLGDNYENGIAWINLPALKFLLEQIQDEGLKTTLLAIILGTGLSHEILGHESGVDDEDLLSMQDVDMFLVFIEQFTDLDREGLLKYLKNTFQERSLFLKCLNDQKLIEKIGLAKILKFLENGDVTNKDFPFISFETTIVGHGNIKGLKAIVNASAEYGSKIKIIPAWNKNYGWYMDVFTWEGDEKTGAWSKEPARTFVFEKSGSKLKIKSLSKRTLAQQEWIDYITEEQMALDGNIVKPGPLVTKVYPGGQLSICMHIITFSCRDLVNKEARVEFVDHPQYGELIYIYDRNKYEWELKEVEKGVRKELSAPVSCYKKTEKGKYEKFCGGLNYDQFLWQEWLNAEYGNEQFTPPDIEVKCNKGGFVRLIIDVIQFYADAIRGKTALVKFAKDPRYKQFHPEGKDEFIFIYDKEKYDREALEIKNGIRSDYSVPEKIYVKSATGKLKNVTDRLSASQLIWLNWMYAEDESTVMRPGEIVFHVGDSGDVLLAHSFGKEIRLNVRNLKNRDAIAKIVDDQNYGQLIYVYDAADYYRQEREIRAGLRDAFAMPPVAYKKTNAGVYEKFPLQVDFNSYVWMQWANQELGKETVKPSGELIVQSYNDSGGTIYIGMLGDKKMAFSSSALRGKRTLVKLVQDPQYGELIYIYDADRYMHEKRKMAEGTIETIYPPESCYKKVETGKFVSFSGNVTLNQRSWAEWANMGSVKPMADMICEIIGHDTVQPVSSTRFGSINFSVFGFKKGTEVRIKYVDDKDFGELVYIYVEEQYRRDHEVSPVQIYRKAGNGDLKPFYGLGYDRLNKYSWLSYAYGEINEKGEKIMPRGKYLRGRIYVNGSFILEAGDKKCILNFNPDKYGGKRIRLVKYEHPKYEYIFKAFPEDDLSTCIGMHVKNPDSQRFMRLEKHPEYVEGDENLGYIKTEEENEEELSGDKLINKLIELAEWVKYWDLSDVFKAEISNVKLPIELANIKLENEHHILKNMENVFLLHVRQGVSYKDAIAMVVREYLFRVEVYHECLNLFGSEVSEPFLNSESINCLYISDFSTIQKGWFDKLFRDYLSANSMLRNYRSFQVDKGTKKKDIMEALKQSEVNVVVIDIDDRNRELKMKLIKELCEELPIPALVIVIQTDPENEYRKTAGELLLANNLSLGEDIEIPPLIEYISHGVKSNSGISEEAMIDQTFDEIIAKLSDETVNSENDIEIIIEKILHSYRLTQEGMRQIAQKLSQVTDENILEKIIGYVKFNSEMFRVNDDKYLHFQKSVGHGRIQFNFMAPPGSEVLLVGDFTGWQENPILIPPLQYRGMRPDGLVRHCITLDNLFGIHHFKYIVNGQVFDDFDSVSPYQEEVVYDEESFKAAKVWSTRLVEDKFFTVLSNFLLKRISDDSLSDDIKKKIAGSVSANVAYGFYYKTSEVMGKIWQYLFTEHERTVLFGVFNNDFTNINFLRTNPIFMKVFYRPSMSENEAAVMVVRNPLSQSVKNCRVTNIPVDESAFYEIVIEDYDTLDLNIKNTTKSIVSGKELQNYSLNVGDFQPNQFKVCYVKKINVSEVKDETIRSVIKATTDVFNRCLLHNADINGVLWGLLKKQNKGKVKIIDAETLVFYDEENKKLYPRSMDFKLGILKLQEQFGEGIKIVVVNSDERFNADEIQRVVGVQEGQVAFVDIKGDRSYKGDLLGAINYKLKGQYSYSDLTIAYLDSNRNVFTKANGARLIKVSDADNKNNFISGLGVLFAVLVDDPDFFAQLPVDIREEIKKLINTGSDNIQLFEVAPQPMTSEYYSMLKEEFEKVGLST
jgi:hypothetical protein